MNDGMLVHCALTRWFHLYWVLDQVGDSFHVRLCNGLIWLLAAAEEQSGLLVLILWKAPKILQIFVKFHHLYWSLYFWLEIHVKAGHN